MITKDYLHANASISITADYEDDQVIGNACPDDPSVEQEIIERVNSGDVWAWCCVQVTASFKGVDCDTYLGHCTYSGQDDFTDNSGYYDDMLEEVISDLYDKIKEIQAIN